MTFLNSTVFTTIRSHNDVIVYCYDNKSTFKVKDILVLIILTYTKKHTNNVAASLMHLVTILL